MTVTNIHAFKARLMNVVSEAARKIEFGGSTSGTIAAVEKLTNTLTTMRKQVDDTKKSVDGTRNFQQQNTHRSQHFTINQSANSKQKNMKELDDAIAKAYEVVSNALIKQIKVMRFGPEETLVVNLLNKLVGKVEGVHELVQSVEKMANVKAHTSQPGIQQDLSYIRQQPSPSAGSLFTLIIIIVRLSTLLAGSRKAKRVV